MRPAAFGDVGEGAVAVVAIEGVLAVVGDEEVVVAVVVVVADAAGLAPTGAASRPEPLVTSVKVPSRLFLKRRQCGSWPFGKAFQAPAVDQEEVEPAVVVVVVEGQAAAGGFEQIFVLASPP